MRMSSLSGHVRLARRCWLVAAVLAGACVGGCRSTTPRPPTTQLARDEYLGLYQPRRVRILEDFTRPASFDDDEVPDGLEVWVRLHDGLGDSVKGYGSFRFELYAFRQASGERRGDRLMVWDQSIGSIADQRRFWNDVMQMYEFPLRWDRPVPPQQRYVLELVYTTPWGRRLFDQRVFEFRLPVTPLGEP